MRGWARLTATALTVAATAAAAQVADPDWPCVQRKVPELSIGQMWPGPLPAADTPPDAGLPALADRLASRRVGIDTVAAEAADFAAELPPEERPERLAALFAAILDRINAERGQIIAGIGRYAHRQTALAERVAATEDELAQLEQAGDAAKDLDRIEEMRNTLAWDTRIFKQRAQSLNYVCETPVLLEQRAFAIARALAGLI